MEEKIKKKLIKLVVPSWEDRQRLVLGLANSGFPVFIEEVTDARCFTKLGYLVCFEVEDNEIHEVKEDT